MSSKLARPGHSPARSRSKKSIALSTAVSSRKPQSPKAGGASARTRGQRPATSPSPRARQEKQAAAARETRHRTSSSPGRGSTRCRLDLDQADTMEQGPTADTIDALLASLSGSSESKGSFGTDSITEANMDLAKKSMQASDFVARNAPEFPAGPQKGPTLSDTRQIRRDVSGPLKADGGSLGKGTHVDIIADKGARHPALAECYDVEETEGESDTERVFLNGSNKMREHDASLPESGVWPATCQLHSEDGEQRGTGRGISKKSLRKLAGLLSILVLLLCLLLARVPSALTDTSGMTGGASAGPKHAKSAQGTHSPSSPGPGAGMNDVAARAHDTWNGMVRRAANGVEAVTGGKQTNNMKEEEEKGGKGGKDARLVKGWKGVDGGKKESSAGEKRPSPSSPNDGAAPWRRMRDGFVSLGNKLAPWRE